MQIDLNLIPQFDAAAGTAMVTEPLGLGIPEFIFFLATYLWESTGGENASFAIDALF